MLTYIMAIKQVIGSEIIFYGSLISFSLSIMIFIMLKSNRNRKAIKDFILTVLIIYEICDAIWLMYFFPNGKYLDRGLAPIGLFLLFPLLSGILIIVYSVSNKMKLSNTKN